MTDKQIIIDGIDVSGCVRLQDDNISCELGGKCQGWDNCYYKNWQRKEQEVDMLKAENERLKRRGTPPLIDVVLTENKLLEQENEELKEKVKKYGEINKQETKDYAELKAENEDLKEYIKHLHNLCVNETDKQYKYKQTLDEIKDIAENGKLFAERWMITGEQKANVLTYANAIIEKISEVDDESYLNNHWLFTENKKGEN